jgi:hypothetical protein
MVLDFTAVLSLRVAEQRSIARTDWADTHAQDVLINMPLHEPLTELQIVTKSAVPHSCFIHIDVNQH